MKDLSKMLVVKELINSLHLLKKNAFWLVMAALIDAVFFVAWGFFTSPVKDKIVEHAVLISNQLSTIMAGKGTGILAHMLSPQLRPMTGKLVVLIAALFIVMYLLYSAFHGTSWWMATKIAGRNYKYRNYMLGFAKINLLWLACYALYKLLDIIISLRHLILEKLSPGTPNIAAKILLVLVILLFITAFLSYPMLKIGTLFTTPFKITAPLVIISASIYLTTQFILNNISKLSLDAALITGLLLLFPAITLIRVYVTRVLTNVHTRN
jgi:hypothetical protein